MKEILDQIKELTMNAQSQYNLLCCDNCQHWLDYKSTLATAKCDQGMLINDLIRLYQDVENLETLNYQKL